MNLEINPISVDDAKKFLLSKQCAVFDTDFDFAIMVTSPVQDMTVTEVNMIHGVIAMKANGSTCSLAHLYTDGTALVGSILYGGAWRACKALGYKSVTI